MFNSQSLLISFSTVREAALGTPSNKMHSREAAGNLKICKNKSKNETENLDQFWIYFWTKSEPVWGPFGVQFEPRTGPRAPRCAQERQRDLPSATNYAFTRDLPSTTNCAFTKTSQSFRFCKVCGVQGQRLSKTASEWQRTLPRCT